VEAVQNRKGAGRFTAESAGSPVPPQVNPFIIGTMPTAVTGSAHY
jgi:hypothetical protein